MTVQRDVNKGRKFQSCFAKRMNEVVQFRKSLGFDCKCQVPILHRFDRYCISAHPEATAITRELVSGWVEFETSHNRTGLRAKLSTLRYFARYLNSVGEAAYVIPFKMLPKASRHAPYIFTDSELRQLFDAVDSWSGEGHDQRIRAFLPVLLRLIYTCGLRPGEAFGLQREDVNFATGEVRVRENKRHKERLVVMSDDMLKLMCEYKHDLDREFPRSLHLFVKSNGKLGSYQMVSLAFREIWLSLHPGVDKSNVPQARIYDLRHRFASAVLQRWLDTGEDIYKKIPFLRAYMGHAELVSTLYYVHLLPENLLKSKGVDWKALNSIIPETRYV